MLIYDRQIITNYWDECSSILRCNNNTMHLIVLLLKIKQLKEETSAI